MTTAPVRDDRRTLAGPYAASVGPEGHAVSPAVAALVGSQVNALLSSSAAWHELSPQARDEMRKNLKKISAYTAALVQEDFALSERLGQTPVLVPSQAMAGPPAQPPPPRPPADQFDTRAADSVARVTRDTLNAIAFPTFVADLIKGTFNAIVDASIKQMEAFGTLLSNVSKTVDQFMADNITDNQARDWLSAQYPQHFEVAISKGDEGGGRRGGSARRPARGAKGGGGPGARLKPRAGSKGLAKPDFRRELGLSQDVELDEKNVEEVLVPAARRRLAQQRHQLLSTMVLMGINRIVVTSGHINAQMGFTIDTSDAGTAESASQFDFKNDTIAGGGFLGFGMVSRNQVAYVSSTKKGSSDSIDVHADLTGEVDLKFKSETFPLERFADMGAINQIQGNTANPAANTPQSATTPPPTAPAPAGAGGP